MAENVETGGLMKFNYGKLDKQQASERVKREIREAYEKAEERKEKEKRNRLIIWTFIIILIVVFFGLLIYVSN